MSVTAESYDRECREAFTTLAREHAALDPNTPGRRKTNATIRARKHAAIDNVLDEWLLHHAISELEFGPICSA